jgi:hypothetical protein
LMMIEDCVRLATAGHNHLSLRGVMTRWFEAIRQMNHSQL